MRKREYLFCLIAILVFSLFIHGDVPPPEDEIRMSSDLIIETKVDVSDFKFFIIFGNNSREVILKKDENTAIEARGGGAMYRSGKLFAIPKKEFSEFGGKITPEQEKKIGNEIFDGKVAGAIELVKYEFSRTIKKRDRANFSYPTYTLNHEGEKLKITENNRISPKLSDEEMKKVGGGGIDIVTYSGVTGFTPLFYILVAGIVLFTLGLIIFGVMKFNKIR